MRVGHGYDIHPLVDGAKLVLGGVEIPFIKGLKGRSDADVLLHSICDAILGGIGAGDLGIHFPESEPWTEGISSLKILEMVKGMAIKRGYRIHNIDATLIAQAPKISPYIPEMIERIARCLDIRTDQINIKATTAEGLGPIGMGEGIEAHAVVLLESCNGGPG
jgi:2-C-methyl-D-erythritol 2,4-cyclodiphosphate synthase